MIFTYVVIAGQPVATEAEARSRIIGAAGTDVRLQVLPPSHSQIQWQLTFALQLHSDGISKAVSITRIP